jgi:hypothetical protein
MRAKRHTLANALRVAADQYEADALVHNTPPADAMYWSDEGRRRIVETFEQQARDARKLADAIEQAERIELED